MAVRTIPGNSDAGLCEPGLVQRSPGHHGAAAVQPCWPAVLCPELRLPPRAHALCGLKCLVSSAVRRDCHWWTGTAR
jgi:hypothetical protein